VKFTIERTPCFGDCPWYSVQVHGDGRVEWEGKHFVARQVKLTGRIEPAAVQMLLDRASEMDFFRRAVSFDESDQDGSNCKLTLRIAGQERRADVPRHFWRKNVDGTEYASWQTMRDEVDFTRAVDALTESWRWIRTLEDSKEDTGPPPTAVPEGFSIGLRRRADSYGLDYSLTIDAAGSGTWQGVGRVREIGERKFQVPPDQMLLLANRASRLVGLGKDITLDRGAGWTVDLFVHAKDHSPGPRRQFARNSGPNWTEDTAAYDRADGLAQLIEVFARTSHFVGSWDEQQAAAPAPK
jgi:hypothetical protein